jgi:hypothetical protein
MTKAELETYCIGETNTSLPIFNAIGPTKVAKYGDPTYGNADDFIEIIATNTATSSWGNAAQECLVSSIVAYNFYVLETGSKKNPQSKIVAAEKTFVTNNWKFMKAVSDER